MIELTINGKARRIEADDDTPLLWVIRDDLRMTGTKFGCGVGECGACTVLVNGKATRTCVTPVEEVRGAAITTIEGLAESGKLTGVQQAWIDEQVPQCGYCQSGMIMAATGLLNEKAQPSDDEINEAITNICRCGTYTRVRKAIHRAAKAGAAGGGSGTGRAG